MPQCLKRYDTKCMHNKRYSTIAPLRATNDRNNCTYRSTMIATTRTKTTATTAGVRTVKKVTRADKKGPTQVNIYYPPSRRTCTYPLHRSIITTQHPIPSTSAASFTPPPHRFNTDRARPSPLHRTEKAIDMDTLAIHLAVISTAIAFF